jgi:ribosomal protein S18 acetylase RimI-like enzyme
LIIRRAEDGDRAAIAALHAASWRDTYRGLLPDSLLDGTLPQIMAERWAGQAIGPADAVLVAEDGDGLLGFCAAWDGEPAYIDNLHVAAAARSRGIGRQLLAEVARHFLARGRHGAALHVVAANHRARALYLALGGRETGVEDKNLYGTRVPNARIAWDRLDLLYAQAVRPRAPARSAAGSAAGSARSG